MTEGADVHVLFRCFALAACLSTAALPATAAETRPGRERQTECMNYFREHPQALSGTPFVNNCLRSSEPAPEIAARLALAKPATAPGADPAGASLYRDCERGAWGRHFACDCVRDTYIEASAAQPGEAGRNCRNGRWLAWCACGAGETHKILLTDPTLVLDSQGNQHLVQQRKKACQVVLPFSPFVT